MALEVAHTGGRPQDRDGAGVLIGGERSKADFGVRHVSTRSLLSAGLMSRSRARQVHGQTAGRAARPGMGAFLHKNVPAMPPWIFR